MDLQNLDTNWKADIEKKNDKYQKEVQSGCKPSFNNFPTNVCGNELEKASSVEGTAFTCDYGN